MYYDEVFQATKTLAASFAQPEFPKIYHGAMPMDSSLSMALGPGSPDSGGRTLGGGGLYQCSIVFNGKHETAEILAPTMTRVHRKLEMLLDPDDLPHDPNGQWSIYKIETSSSPQYSRKEVSTEQWVYVSALRVYFTVKGEC